MTKKAQTKNRIIVGVVVGIILSIVVDPIRNFLFWIFLWFFRSSVSLPVWFFVPILLLALLFILRLLAKLRRPEWNFYTQDVFWGMVWRWNYSMVGGNVLDIAPYCPDDDTLLVFNHLGLDQYETIFACESCGKKFGPFRGDVSYTKNRIQRQIDRKIRNKIYPESTRG